jgi:hypothetical protein
LRTTERSETLRLAIKELRMSDQGTSNGTNQLAADKCLEV